MFHNSKYNNYKMAVIMLRTLFGTLDNILTQTGIFRDILLILNAVKLCGTCLLIMKNTGVT